MMQSFCWLAILSHLLHSLDAGYNVSVELFSYVSTKHILKNGFCCDISNSQSECQDDCDNRFIFCLRRTGSGGLSCPSNSTTYQTSNTSPDFVIFSSGVDIDDGVPNPLIFTGERWPGTMEFFVRIEDVDFSSDYDGSTNDPLINTFSIPVSFAGMGTSPVVYRDFEHGSVLRLSYQISCFPNFYGENCSTYCLPKDDESGHYTCNQQGSIECLSGYQNPLTNCTECSLAPGCSSIGGYCNSSHCCLCLERFTGDNCDECVGIYTGMNCSHCRNNFAGENCSECAERHTGMDCSDCIEGYTGEGCLECEDDYMHNGTNCVKCKENFTGKNCSLCSSRYSGEDCSMCRIGYIGVNCSMCDEGYGGWNCTKCKEGFTGLNCSECLFGYVGDECKPHNGNSENCTSCEEGDIGRNCTELGGNCSACSDADANGSNCTTQCKDGFAGVNCSECMNGYGGENCTKFTSCRLDKDKSPCKNGGICKATNDSYHQNFTCECPKGFDGQFCDEKVNGCVPNPCKNSGICQILQDSNVSRCICNGEFWGEYCEKSHPQQIDFFFPFIGVCAFIGILLLVVVAVITTFSCYCCKKRRMKNLRSSENSIPNGDASGYLIRALNPFSSSSELDVSVPGLAKITGRKSELFDNPIYDKPSVEVVRSINSQSINSREREDDSSRTGGTLYATKLEMSNMDALSASQNSSYYERSCDSIQSQCRGKAGYRTYEEIKVRQDKNSKGNNKEENGSSYKDQSNFTTDGESMLTIVNASYEALPCHTQKMAARKPYQRTVLQATGQISDNDSMAEGLSKSLEVPGKRTPGYKPTFIVVEEHSEDSPAKSPSPMKTKKY